MMLIYIQETIAVAPGAAPEGCHTTDIYGVGRVAPGQASLAYSYPRRAGKQPPDAWWQTFPGAIRVLAGLPKLPPPPPGDVGLAQSSLRPQQFIVTIDDVPMCLR